MAENSNAANYETNEINPDFLNFALIDYISLEFATSPGKWPLGCRRGNLACPSPARDFGISLATEPRTLNT